MKTVWLCLQNLVSLYVLACAFYATISLLSASIIVFNSNMQSFRLLFQPSQPPSAADQFSLHNSFHKTPSPSIPPNALALPQDIFHSKAFANSLQPMRIIPYLYRASDISDSRDVTVTTLISLDRFDRFSRLVHQYRGPISVSVHVKNTTIHLQELLTDLHNMYSSSPLMAAFVDVHLIIDSYDRQFNTWRNVARLYARTDFVMMLDVDFYLCTNFRSAIRQSPVVLDMLQNGHTAFVVPAFEYLDEEQEPDYLTFPANKEALLSLVEEGRITMFHASWSGGHNSTDYPRYYQAGPGEIYRVTGYQSAYEPYLIFKKSGPPWCEERFIGYGGNKAACIFQMYLSGISFYVLSDHFIVHQSHEYAELTRASERKVNRRIYSEFRQEACLRYIRGFSETSFLNSSIGHNVIEQCRSVEGVARLASKILNSK
ncbi:glycosyltransferase family 49 protein [Flagelloscypha sp. PMI_526]|nr:glycosyltransferase family 49 protein [Flagelloscypha sp. PMI_526]